MKSHNFLTPINKPPDLLVLFAAKVRGAAAYRTGQRRRFAAVIAGRHWWIRCIARTGSRPHLGCCQKRLRLSFALLFDRAAYHFVSGIPASCKHKMNMMLNYALKESRTTNQAARKHASLQKWAVEQPRHG